MGYFRNVINTKDFETLYVNIDGHLLSFPFITPQPYVRSTEIVFQKITQHKILRKNNAPCIDFRNPPNGSSSCVPTLAENYFL